MRRCCTRATRCGWTAPISADRARCSAQITLVYPQIQDGRVHRRRRPCPGSAATSSASASRSGSAPASARAIVIPAGYVFRRASASAYVQAAACPAAAAMDGAGAARPRPADAGDARRRGDPLRAAERRRCWCGHESRHFRTADAGDAPLAADAAVPAGGAGRRAGRAADHPARGGPADPGCRWWTSWCPPTGCARRTPPSW